MRPAKSQKMRSKTQAQFCCREAEEEAKEERQT